MSKSLNIIIEKNVNSYYAYYSHLERCQTQSDTLDEVTEKYQRSYLTLS